MSSRLVSSLYMYFACDNLDTKYGYFFTCTCMQVLDIISKGGVKGIAHITGGGFTDNIPRVFPSGLGAKIFTDSWEIPAVFKWLKEVPTSSIYKFSHISSLSISCIL